MGEALPQSPVEWQIPVASTEVIQKSLRVLVISDVDIKSAAQLADFSVHDADFNNSLNAGIKNGLQPAYNDGIELCMACGPFVHDHIRSNERDEGGDSSKTVKQMNQTLEQDIGNEGFMTCVLSQLENIVCRLVYVPCKTCDPRRTTEDGLNGDHLRLTPNSRNVYNRILPMLYGLGVAGLSGRQENDNSGKSNEKRKRQYEMLEGIIGNASCHDGRPRQAIVISTHPNGYDGEVSALSSFDNLLGTSFFQNNVILYVCSAKSEDCKQFSYNNGNVIVLNPGSLRLRGEFAIVDVRFDRQQTSCSANMQEQLWKIDKVQLRSLSCLKRNSYQLESK